MNIRIRTKDIVASLTRWKTCWIYSPYASRLLSMWLVIYRQGRSIFSFCPQGFWTLSCFLWYPLHAKKDDLRFEVLHSLFNCFRNTVSYCHLTARSPFAVSSRGCASASWLCPTAWNNSQNVLKIQKQQPTIFFDDHISNWECGWMPP